MKDEIIALASDIICIPSVTGDLKECSKALEVVKKYLDGFTVKQFEKDGVESLLFFNQPTIPKEFTVILNAHVDVVSAKEKQYTPRIDGDRLYGRGAYDMKAAAAAEIIAFAHIAKSVHYPLGLQLVTDEEIGGFKGTKYQVEQGIKAQLVLVGETSSDFSLGIRAKGILWVNIRFTGKSAHGAHPWSGDNALWTVQKFLTQVKEKYPIPQREAWQTTVNVASIETTNKTYNKVPDDALLRMDVRYIPEEGLSATEKTLRSLLPSGSTMEMVVQEPAHATDTSNPFVERLSKIVAQELGKEPKIVSKHGASDLRHFPKAAGIEFGPVGEGPHTDSEWVSISSLETYYQILRKFLLSI